MRTLSAPALLCALLATGCGGSANTAPTLTLPNYDADAISQAAVKQLDKNGDGQIDTTELAACPGLRDALGELDTSGDKKLSAAELRDRFARYAGSSPVPVVCTVTIDGQAAAGVTVQFVPEPFMGSEVKQASGTTSETGRAVLKLEGQEAHGVLPGVYKVVVTRPGKELPAQYNTQTTLGREVFDGSRGNSGEIELRLKSR